MKRLSSLIAAIAATLFLNGCLGGAFELGSAAPAPTDVKVVAGDGATFELEYGWSGNAKELDAKGNRIASYCIHPHDRVPHADNVLAQKLMLEADPAEFRRIANRTPLVPAR